MYLMALSKGDQMHNFKKHLLEKYGKSIKELSETEHENSLIDNNFQMISWDDVAEDFLKFNNDFNEKFSSADALYILEKEDKVQLFFFEFKNINYSNIKNRQVNKFHLNRCIKKMALCSNDCEIYEDIKKHAEKLVDVSHVSLRSKPSDSISLLYYMMNNFFEDHPDETEDLCKEKLFKIEKFFFLVSSTQQQYAPFYKNKSNRHNNIVKPLIFLKRFEPYHYKMVFSVNDKGFHKFFCEWNEKYLN